MISSSLKLELLNGELLPRSIICPHQSQKVIRRSFAQVQRATPANFSRQDQVRVAPLTVTSFQWRPQMSRPTIISTTAHARSRWQRVSWIRFCSALPTIYAGRAHYYLHENTSAVRSSWKMATSMKTSLATTFCHNWMIKVAFPGGTGHKSFFFWLQLRDRKSASLFLTQLMRHSSFMPDIILSGPECSASRLSWIGATFRRGEKREHIRFGALILNDASW